MRRIISSPNHKGNNSVILRIPALRDIPQLETKVQHPERGIAIAEAAIVAPFLVLILLLVGDFGRGFYYSIALTNAARAAAQYGTFKVTNTSDTAGISQAAIQEAADIGTISVSSRKTCRCPDNDDEGDEDLVNCTNGSCGAYGPPRIYLRVTVTKTFRSLVPFPGLPSTITLTRKARFRAQ